MFLSKIEFPSILVARQRIPHVSTIYFTSSNIASTLFDTIDKMKGPLLYIYCFRFEIILNSSLLRQKCRQRERTSLRGGPRLPSNSTLKMIRCQHLYAIKHKGSFYRCFKYQSRERDINQLSVIFD